MGPPKPDPSKTFATLIATLARFCWPAPGLVMLYAFVWMLPAPMTGSGYSAGPVEPV